MQTALVTILFLAGGTWVGGLPTLLHVRRAADRDLETAARVALFRSVGRSYGRVAGGAFALAAVVGGILAGSPGGWSAWQAACAVLAVAVAVMTAAGVVQARAITHQRQQAIDSAAAESPDLSRMIASAGMLRGLIAAGTVAIVVIVAYGVTY